MSIPKSSIIQIGSSNGEPAVLGFGDRAGQWQLHGGGVLSRWSWHCVLDHPPYLVAYLSEQLARAGLCL